MEMMYHFFYQLGQLKEECRNRPTQSQLIEEIYREFARHSTLPNHLEICLKKHYSHRMLKKTFRYLGYRISTKPCSLIFQAWRAPK